MSHTYKNNKQNKQNPSEYPFTCLSFLTLLSWFCIQNKIKLFLFLIFFCQCLCLDLRHYHPLPLRTNALAFPLGSQLFLSFYIPRQNISLVMLFKPRWDCGTFVLKALQRLPTSLPGGTKFPMLPGFLSSLCSSSTSRLEFPERRVSTLRSPCTLATPCPGALHPDALFLSLPPVPPSYLTQQHPLSSIRLALICIIF